MSSNNQMRQILTGLSASRRSLISRSLWHLSAFQSALGRTLDRLFPTDDPPAFQLALAEEVPPPRWLTQIREAENKDESPLAGLLGPISWIKGQTAKRRFSYYELKRKWYTLKTNSHMNKFGRPLLQVTHCLECGNLTLPNCVCPHCYEKVRETTEKLKEQLGYEFKHEYPAKEVRFAYENEQFGSENSKLKTINVEGERPSWFSKEVLPRKMK